ncbi:helix-turn-helix domain-containing protein [Amycolatopsis jiangsuensis]|uniref:Transcriptional regulator with XRE-family HTH domain n=1 Tax=Amycolatopsis jiangsuensis TaxID=1181879 RepID=A0A840J347_9PSEU|nr:XRE family transcriptional regulator [Amycolatopsis jiangsuensis]MBB4688045.1 transcriptional regulator with XRE-family HTH domain [Amycolatopsis jiangsuensis]
MTMAEGEVGGLGDRIRALRMAKALSIRELAARAGVSTGLISQVERGLTDPSLQTARVLAKALETPLFDLFAEPEKAAVAVVRKDRRLKQQSPHGEISYERVSPGSGRLELLEGTLRPGGVSSGRSWTHPSEECVVVTRGVLVVEVDGAEHRLAEGDSCYFDSRLPHRYRNDGSGPATFLVAVTPPSY